MSLLGKGSIFDKIGRAVGDVARPTLSLAATASKFTPLAPLAPVIGGIVQRIAPSTSPFKVPAPAPPPTLSMPAYQAPFPTPTGGGSAGAAARAGGGGIIGTAIGGAIGAIAPKIGQYLPGLAPSQAGGCGCGGSRGRDACTHQIVAHQPAPLATFFGGCCPPGRVLRRKPFGRDICIRQPRMNPFNPRALARADRRLTSFARRAAPMLKDLGYDVSRHRHVTIKTKGRKRARR